MPANYPTESDLMTLLYAANLIDSPTTPTGTLASLDYRGACRAAAVEFERLTGRRFQRQSGTRLFDPPTNRDGILDPNEEFGAITACSFLTQSMVLGTDYILLPEDAPGRGEPYREIKFYQIWTTPIGWALRKSLSITATWGYQESVPEDVWQAVLRRAGGMLVPQIVVSEVGFLKGWTTQGRGETYGDMPGAVLSGWQTDWRATLQLYQRRGMVW